MKKTLLSLLISIFVIGAAHSQNKKNSSEVLYFKANLPCCMARSCNVIQSEIESTVSKYFADNNIAFKVVMLADENNKELVEKYKAGSQTLILVTKKRKKETMVDLSPIINSYKQHGDKAKFEQEIKEKIKNNI